MAQHTSVHTATLFEKVCSVVMRFSQAPAAPNAVLLLSLLFARWPIARHSQPHRSGTWWY
jgi:hypothetical protein